MIVHAILRIGIIRALNESAWRLFRAATQPSSKNSFTDRSKAVLLLWIRFVIYVAVLSVHCSLVVTCWKRANLLALLCVMFSCVLSLSHLMSMVRCGT